MDQVPLPTPPQSPLPSQPVVSETSPATPAVAPTSFGPTICPRCHFPVKPEYYYCPNCGAKLSEPPLPTGLVDQLLLYAFSLILPWIVYLAITKWQGIKYLRASSSRARQIGLIALILLVASSIVFFWLSTVWIQGTIQSSLNDVNNINSFGSGL